MFNPKKRLTLIRKKVFNPKQRLGLFVTGECLTLVSKNECLTLINESQPRLRNSANILAAIELYIPTEN